MYQLTRYILVQLLAVFLVSLGGITALMLIVGVVREAHDMGLGLYPVLRLLPYILPDALRFAVPATILFAATFVFGRMASTNEIVAIKAMGISPWRLLWPTFAAVTLLSFAAVWLNDLAVSWGRNGIRRIVIESIEEIAYGMLETQGSYSTPQFSINVKRVEGRRLILPTITFQQTGKTPSVVIRAEWAELQADPDADTLTILLHNGHAVGGGVSATFPGTIRRVLPLSGASRQGRSTQRPSQMALKAIPQQIAGQRVRIEQLEQQLATRAAFQLALADWDALADAQWVRWQHQLATNRQQYFRLKTEPYRRWAAGFSCLCFVAVGAPLAIRRRHGEVWTTFFLCFLPILLVYYPLLMVSIDRAKVGAVPPYTVWLGNLTLLAWSAWLLRRVIRY